MPQILTGYRFSVLNGSAVQLLFLEKPQSKKNARISQAFY